MKKAIVTGLWSLLLATVPFGPVTFTRSLLSAGRSLEYR